MRCPRCMQPAQRSETLIPGHVCFRCCGAVAVEGWDQWFPIAPETMATLLEIAARVEEARNVQREIRESESDDPRWTTTTLY